MTAIAIQTDIQPMPPASSAGQMPNGASSPAGAFASGGSTFSDQLDRAMKSGQPAGAPDSPSSKPTQFASADAPATLPKPNHPASTPKGSAVPGAPGAPQSTNPAAASPASTSSQPVQATTSASSQAQGETQAKGQPQAGNVVSASLLWLTEMIPFAADFRAASSAVSGAEKAASSAAQAGAQNVTGAAAQGKSETNNIPAEVDAVKNLATAGSKIPGAAKAGEADQSSGQSASGAQAPNSSTSSNPNLEAASNNAQMQSVLRSLESMGLSSVSTSTAASATNLPSSAGKISTPPPTTAALNSPVHAPQPKVTADTAAQSAARDVSATTVGAGSSGSGHGDSGNAVKATSSPDNSKSGNGQNAQQGKSSSQQAGAGIDGGASAAAAANQATASSFGATLNQAAQPGIVQPGQSATAAPGSAAATGQLGTAQPTVAEKVATAMQNPVNASGGVVSAASLFENQGKTEMRVALQTDTMGALQLHAVLDNGRVGASISVMSHEAHTLLTNELPSLQQALADQNVRLDHLTVINTPMTSGGMGDSRGFQSADYNQQRNQSNTLYSGSMSSAQAPAAISSQTSVQEEIRRRLSVRA